MRVLACVSLLCLALPVPAADPPFDPAARARNLAPLIEKETIALVRVDFTRIDVDGLAKQMSALLPGRKEMIAEVADRMKKFQTSFVKAGLSELVVSFSTEDIPAISFVYVPLKDGANVPALTGLLKPYLPAGAVVQRQELALTAGAPEVLRRLAAAKRSVRAELLPAVKAAGDTAVQVLLLLTPEQRRVIDEVLVLPAKDAGPKVLSRGVLWAALGVDIGEKPRAELTLQSADTAAARKVADLIGLAVDLVGKKMFLGEEKPLKDLFPKEFAAVKAALKPTVTGSQVTVQLHGRDSLRAVAVLADAAEERLGSGIERTPGANLKQILLAMHNYHSAFGTFPPHAIYSKAGKPLLSWRVALLPFMEQVGLYQQFKLDEAWDSPHNKKLIAKIPPVYRSAKIKDPRPGLTTYLAPVNKDFIFTGGKEGVQLKDILDGTSNTAIVVDVNDETGVVWTKPDDLVVSRKDPWKGLVGHYPGFVLVGMADGSVRRVAKTVKASTMWALFTRAGGEVLPDLSK